MIKALAITTTNWTDLIGTLKSIDSDAIRCLDQLKVGQDNLLAAPLVIQSLINEKHANYNDITPKVLKHQLVVLIAKADLDVINQINESTDLKTLIIHSGKYEHLFILSGTLDLWVESIYLCSRRSGHKDLRTLFNGVFDLFQRTDLRKLWADAKKTKLKDGTYIIER